MACRKKDDPPENAPEDPPPVRRSSRSTQGQGGAIKQLEKISNALYDNGKLRVKAKTAAVRFPDNEPINPMAPTSVKKKQGRKTKDKIDDGRDAEHTPPAASVHTQKEPATSLKDVLASQPSLHLATAGSRFGLHARPPTRSQPDRPRPNDHAAPADVQKPRSSQPGHPHAQPRQLYHQDEGHLERVEHSFGHSQSDPSRASPAPAHPLRNARNSQSVQSHMESRWGSQPRQTSRQDDGGHPRKHSPRNSQPDPPRVSPAPAHPLHNVRNSHSIRSHMEPRLKRAPAEEEPRWGSQPRQTSRQDDGGHPRKHFPRNSQSDPPRVSPTPAHPLHNVRNSHSVHSHVEPRLKRAPAEEEPRWGSQPRQTSRQDDGDHPRERSPSNSQPDPSCVSPAPAHPLLNVHNSRSIHSHMEPHLERASVEEEARRGSQPRQISRQDDGSFRLDRSDQLLEDEPRWGSQPRLKLDQDDRIPEPQRGSQPHKKESDPGVKGSVIDDADTDNEQVNDDGGYDNEFQHDEPMNGNVLLSFYFSLLTTFKADMRMMSSTSIWKVVYIPFVLHSYVDHTRFERSGRKPAGPCEPGIYFSSTHELHANHNIWILDISGLGIKFDEYSEDEGYDVLAHHHVKNRRPQPPPAGYLKDVQGSGSVPLVVPQPKNKRARKAPKGRQPLPHRRQSISTAHNSSSLEVEPTRKRGKFSVNPKNKIIPDPTKIGYYPPLWKDFLEKCKVEMRLHASTIDPFPTLPEAAEGIAMETLTTMLAMYKQEKRSLERNIWPEHKLHMARLVYDDLFTFRSELKKFIGPIVVANYPLFPNRPLPSADEHKAFVKKAAKRYLKKGKYLLGEPDEEVRHAVDLDVDLC
ncbi:hypothetical protein BV22DRAFT_1134867 [Leucogyrophana mollusca]|uniref:Uncharacterized protein n=1 Tax=Leucogyrophana mollusca TaxID=85980 RepID=A0ACB8AY04_9AGAM|nr:hypothetical protein BV22DRAFT_1134867 [Leucogyrophana mollusca]